MDIKSLELTEQDFQLLIEGLDALPEKGAAGELFGDVLAATLSKDDPMEQSKLKEKLDARKKERQLKKDQQADDIKILQGKLLMLKRFLITEGALKQAYDTLGQKTF